MEVVVTAKSDRTLARRATLLAAAAEVFLEQGYTATSIDAIIERAGGSKRNIYNEFGSKEGMFTALVSKFAEEVLSSLVIEELEGRDLRGTLIAFGEHLMGVYMSPALIGVYRTVVAEANRYPALGKAFYAHGPARATTRLAEVLQTAKARGEICCEDCSRVADHFVGMIRDNLHLQVVLGLRPPPGADEAHMLVLSVVDLFLNGVKSR